MKKQTYDIKDRLLEYMARIIKIVEQLPSTNRVLKRPFDRLTVLSGVEGLKRKGNSHSKFDIGFSFDVRRSMFNVHL
jgi:hypothetical protein